MIRTYCASCRGRCDRMRPPRTRRRSDERDRPMRRWGSIRSLRKRSSHKISTEFWGATVKGEIGRVRAYREVTVRTMTFVVAIWK